MYILFMLYYLKTEYLLVYYYMNIYYRTYKYKSNAKPATTIKRPGDE